MNSVKKLNINKLCALDIETVRIVDKYEDLSEAGKAAWSYKNKHQNVTPDYGELSRLWESSASLYPEFSKVCSIGFAFQNGEELRTNSITSTDELQLLEDTIKILNSLTSKGYKLVGHSAKYFDFPFLSKRCIINNLAVPSILDVCGLKPWELGDLLDTNELYKSGFTGSGSSLIALAFALNLPSPKVDIDGSMVAIEYFKGNLDVIDQYVKYDAITTLNIIKRFRGEDVFDFEGNLIYSGPPKPDIEGTIQMIAKEGKSRTLYNVQFTDTSSIQIKIGSKGTPPSTGDIIQCDKTDVEGVYSLKQ